MLDEAVRARIDAVRSAVVEHGARSEALGRLPEEITTALADHGLYAMVVPRALGGLELDPLTALGAVVELSELDSAVGWNANQCCAGVTMASRLPLAGIDEVFAGERVPVFAGAGFPPCTGTAIDGGYRVSGTVRFVSGVHAADWVFAMFVVGTDGDAPPGVRVGLFATDDVEVLDTWHVMGMRGTGSNDIALSDVFVPERRTGSMVPPSRPVEAFSGTLHRLFPWNVVLGEAAVSIGIARRGVALAIELSQTKVAAQSTVPARERELVQAAVGRARARVEAAWAYLRSTLGDAAASLDAGVDALSQDCRLSLQLAACTAAEAGAEAVDLVYEALGSSAFVDANRIEQCFRDLHVLTQHGTKSAPRYAAVGRAMLGLDPGVALLA